MCRAGADQATCAVSHHVSSHVCGVPPRLKPRVRCPTTSQATCAVSHHVSSHVCGVPPRLKPRVRCPTTSQVNTP
ncbi:hypothetical protein NHX12_011730 [Muraenolepis orangiensis]|uniref:Uncharacterized protein n=1 Tax=Muraenolepis orangiensis TaxID=630683 RepID=A0A9Q0DGE7_9TELE|nr:hypothetical protein NHX12_011730 [Muraenolepis orangiensis]